jgi:glycosyltransferase involved in cell wall biosynthesis
MKIGFDISQTGEDKAGCGYFADSLIQSLVGTDQENKYLLYPHFGTSFWDPAAKKTTRHVDARNVSRIVIGNDFHESQRFWKQFPEQGEEMLGNPDIVHANNFSCPEKIKRAKVVYTLYDLSFLIYPEFTSEQNRWTCFEGVFNASCYADFIVAISNYSRESFLKTFPHYPADRIRVVPLGSRFSSTACDHPGTAVAGLVPHSFLLAVGTLEPRKNLRRLLKAYAAFLSRNQRVLPLVLAGGKGWLEDDLEAFIGTLGLREQVKILGYVEDDELSWLYTNCYAFIYPSLFEGFGLPVLEALSLGAAVVTSNTTSLPEVAGDAGYYVDPLKEEELVAAMTMLMNDENYRMELKSRAKFQARKFSWKRCATEVLNIYREVIKRPKRNSGGGPEF